MKYRPVKDAELDELGALIAESFNIPFEISRPWIENSGVANWRVVADAHRLLGGAMRIPMAQWFGGKAVGMTGLAGVIVSPRARGRGVGQELIAGTLKEMRDNGTALSALYGSTTSFYRRTGYERAGASYELELPLKQLSFRGGPLEIRTLTVDDDSRVQKLQHEWVREQACLERGPYLWHRIMTPKGQPADRYGFFRDDKMEGYVIWKRSPNQGFANDLQITDLVLTTAEAQETFLGYLAGHRAMYDKATWTCPSSTSLLLSFDEPWSYQMKLKDHWMLRIVDIEKAFTERGYAPGVSGHLYFSIEDSVFSQNCGCWTLEVKDGRGHFKSGGEGTIKTDIGALACLYSGFLSATQLSVAGRLEATENQMALADTVFRSEPRLCDYF